MTNKKSYKPTRITEGYRLKKQSRGGYKIIEFWRMSNENNGVRQRILYKDLLMNEAEERLYLLESKHNK